MDHCILRNKTLLRKLIQNFVKFPKISYPVLVVISENSCNFEYLCLFLDEKESRNAHFFGKIKNALALD